MHLVGNGQVITLSINQERMFLKSIPSITAGCHCSFLAFFTITYQVGLETGIPLYHTCNFTPMYLLMLFMARVRAGDPFPKDGSVDVLPKGGMLLQLPEGRQSKEKDQTPSDSSVARGPSAPPAKRE